MHLIRSDRKNLKTKIAPQRKNKEKCYSLAAQHRTQTLSLKYTHIYIYLHVKYNDK